MNLPGVVRIKLEIAPTSFSDLSCGDFSVVKKNGVAKQQVCNTVTGLLTASLNRRLLITATGADARLIFEVVS